MEGKREVEVDLGFLEPEDFKYCPHCGARMDGGDTDE